MRQLVRQQRNKKEMCALLEAVCFCHYICVAHLFTMSIYILALRAGDNSILKGIKARFGYQKNNRSHEMFLPSKD
jgi:hypothetical protein